jgi:hypothetical protein
MSDGHAVALVFPTLLHLTTPVALPN